MELPREASMVPDPARPRLFAAEELVCRHGASPLARIRRPEADPSTPSHPRRRLGSTLAGPCRCTPQEVAVGLTPPLLLVPRAWRSSSSARS